MHYLPPKTEINTSSSIFSVFICMNSFHPGFIAHGVTRGQSITLSFSIPVPDNTRLTAREGPDLQPAALLDMCGRTATEVACSCREPYHTTLSVLCSMQSSLHYRKGTQFPFKSQRKESFVITYYVRFYDLRAVNMKITIFWEVIPCCLLEIYQLSVKFAGSFIMVLFWRK
jgi:hypothetical protein